MLSINYNSASRKAINQVDQAQTGIAKAMNELSTGNRINNAADDVAGSAMASRMQLQSNSLDTAVTNANIGINLIKTMDSIIKETETLLQRMTKLTEMSKNDAYSAQDRDMMNEEFGVLANELDRNANSTNYNGISLLNNAGNTAGKALFDKDISKGITFTATNNELNFTILTTPMTTATPPTLGGSSSEEIKVQFGTQALSANQIIGTINSAINTKFTGLDKDVAANATINSEGLLEINLINPVDGIKIGAAKIDSIDGSAASTLGLGKAISTPGERGFNNLIINIGSSGNSYDNINLHTVNLSAKGLKLEGVSLTDSNNLDKTLSTLKAALDTAIEQRSHLGASQKRLIFASNNLQNVKNSTDASLSNIQDTDYAQTTMQLAKEKVLSSASQAMLGQSNQMQSQVIDLLQ